MEAPAMNSGGEGADSPLGPLRPSTALMDDLTRDIRGRVRRDLCKCGGLKNITAKMCRDCNAQNRVIPNALPNSKALSYFPQKGRYALLAVVGYAPTGRPGVSFSVLDSHDMWNEVKRVTTSLKIHEQKREELVAEVKMKNLTERSAR